MKIIGNRRPVKSSIPVARAWFKRLPEARLFPLKRGTKDEPLIKDNLKRANNTVLWCEKQHALHSFCNWGMALPDGNILVIDVDTKPGKIGDFTLSDLELKHDDLPATLTVQTPSGGQHRYFRCPPGHKAKLALGKNGLGPDVDLPNYVVIPGCIVDGKPYTITNDVPMAVAPEWIWVDYLDKAKIGHNAEPQAPAVDLDLPANEQWCIDYLKAEAPDCIEGQGGEKTLFDVACVLKDRGISENRAVELLDEHYNIPGKCDPLWIIGEGPDKDRLDVKVHNAFAYASEVQPGSRTPEFEFGNDPLPPETPAEAKARERHKLEKAKAREQLPPSAGHNKGPRLEIIDYDKVEGQNIDYIWHERLARGKHTIWAGIGGYGKSQLMYDAAARISRNSEWPCHEGQAPQGSVIFLNAEDDPRDMTQPRLVAAGADLKFIKGVKAKVDEKGGKKKFNLLTDLDLLYRVCRERGDVVMVVVDPLGSYLGGEIDSHRDTELRNALDPISEFAASLGCAISSVAHFNKATSMASAINRVMGGAAFVNAPRCAMGILGDPDDDKARLVLGLKTNIGGLPQGLRYTLETVDAGWDRRTDPPKVIRATHVVYSGHTDLSADAVVSWTKEKDAPQRETAEAFLQAFLANGPKLAKEIKAAAEAHCITSATLRRAKDMVGVEAVPSSDVPPVWSWRLRAGSDDDFGV